MTNSRYRSSDKPVKIKGGQVHDGNLRKKETIFNDETYLFTIGNHESFNGFSGVSEFESFPIRQLFLNRHNKLASEWDNGYFHLKDVNDYVIKNKQFVIANHYRKNGMDISKSLLYLGGKENLYAYIYNRGFGDDTDKYGVCLLFTSKTKKINSLINYFNKLVIPVEEKIHGHLHILVKEDGGFSLEPKEITCPDIDFSINYNYDFKEIHNIIFERLSLDNSKGIVLFSGKAGTGKTTYIRYLINKLKKKIIYVPPNLTNSISDPELVKFFLKHPNSILIIEDAENVLIKRSAGSSQAIANILNLSDGLLSDCINMQIVATFNTSVLNIDEAIMRKGRLIAKYEFTELEIERAEKLGKKLGIKIEGEHTLADIYNAQEKTFVNKRKLVGF